MKHKFLKSITPYVEREVYVECDCSCSVLKFFAFGNTEAEPNMVFISVLGPCRHPKSLTVRCTKVEFKIFINLFRMIYELNRPDISQVIVIDDNILKITKDRADHMHIVCYSDRDSQAEGRCAWEIKIASERVSKLLKYLNKLLKYIKKSGARAPISIEI